MTYCDIAVASNSIPNLCRSLLHILSASLLCRGVDVVIFTILLYSSHCNAASIGKAEQSASSCHHVLLWFIAQEDLGAMSKSTQ